MLLEPPAPPWHRRRVVRRAVAALALLACALGGAAAAWALFAPREELPPARSLDRTGGCPTHYYRKVGFAGTPFCCREGAFCD
jgi:hypothetical protein